jgi:lipopolysaccharide transport system permease protein
MHWLRHSIRAPIALIAGRECFLVSALRLLHRYRRILYATTMVEIRSRYVGTTFGLSWAILYPFLFLGLYATVYALILQVRLPQFTPTEYVLLVFSGLIPFIGFSEALSASTSAVVGNKHLIKNTMFPIELVPVKSVIAGSLSMTIGLIGLLCALWCRGDFHRTQILIIPLLLIQMIFSIGVGWILSAINVFFRDTAQAIGILVLFLMIVSPIGYTRDMIPHELLALAYVNPLTYIIELYRQVLIFGIVSPRFWLAFIILAWATFGLGYEMFRRLKPVFAEYV